MKQYNIKISEGELNNLNIFMQRIDLKGSEVPAYVEIMNMLNNPDKSEDNVED